jgi:hypothetical protein
LAYIKTPTVEAGDAADSLPRSPAAYHEATGQNCYKCNCTTCVKLSFWHLRLADSPGDFYVFASPAEPPADGGAAGPLAAAGEDWGAYRCGPRRNIDWVFCRHCGARPFGFRGEWEPRESVDLPAEVQAAADAVADAAAERDGGPRERPLLVWSPQRDDWDEVRSFESYLSVNLTSVDAKQEGFDLRDFSRFNWILYLEALNDSDQEGEVPFEGGMF